ncbi:MAG: zf-HC2 domain-containing protein [candidate division Zixibacteria bacterium]|nr:zf-HC2 domain-containing protein [candidate division Zixibacteria bacterium]
MIKCTDIEQNLINLLDGSIDSERRVDFESHLKDCPTCRQLLATYQPLFDRFTNRATVELPSELWYKLQDKLNRMEESRPSRLRLPVQWRPVISLSIRSFGLVVAVVAGIFLGHVPTDSQKLSETEIIDYYATSLTQATVSSAVDAIYQIDATGENGQ